MKFQPKKRIKEGTIRIVKRFAFFPITEYLKTENPKVRTAGLTVWMETVYIKQEFIQGYDTGDYWTNHEFVSEKKYLNFIKTSL